MGRPSKYSAEIQQAANEYIDGGHISEGDVVPTVEGLAYLLELDTATLQRWEGAETADAKAFCGTLDKLKKKQAKMLISSGLDGGFNSNITKLMLANHGYSDKSEQKHTGDITVTKRVIEFV